MFAPGNNDPDSFIRATDGDASLARLSAVRKGYLVDPFAIHFVSRPNLQPPRPPLINIGTYLRTTAIDSLIEKWLELCSRDGQKCQVVSLGAGSDTRFWRLSSSGQVEKLARYIELDFPEITTKKAMAIKKHKDLSSLLGDPTDITLADGGTSLRSRVYQLLAADLRQDPAESLGPLLLSRDSNGPLLDPSLPTLLLFECVLCYMSPEKSWRLLQWFKGYTSPLTTFGCVIYEMFGLDDPFGRVMKNNLMARNVTLPGSEPFQTITQVQRRLVDLGLSVTAALSLETLRKERTSKSELLRISKLEMLDEVEELDLVLGHYAISWGVAVPDTERHKWSEWEKLLSSESEESVEQFSS